MVGAYSLGECVFSRKQRVVGGSQTNWQIDGFLSNRRAACSGVGIRLLIPLQQRLRMWVNSVAQIRGSLAGETYHSTWDFFFFFSFSIGNAFCFTFLLSAGSLVFTQRSILLFLKHQNVCYGPGPFLGSEMEKWNKVLTLIDFIFYQAVHEKREE